MAATLRATGLFGRLFGARYKAAIDFVRSLGADTRQIKIDALCKQLDAYVELKDRSELFVQDPAYVAATGPWSNGLNSPLDDLAALADWDEHTRLALARFGADGAGLGKSIFALEAERMAELVERLGTADFQSAREEFQRIGSDWPDGRTLMEELVSASIPHQLRAAVLDVAARGTLSQAALASTAASASLAAYREREAVFFDLLELDLEVAGLPDGLDDRMLRLNSMVENLPSLLPWVGYSRLRRDIASPAIETLLVEAEEGRLPPTLLPAAWEFARDRAIARTTFQKSPVLHKATGAQLAANREGFRQLDEEVMELRRAEIAKILHGRSIPPGVRASRVSDLTERALLEHQIGLQRRHRPIRDIMRRAGRAIQAMKPCFMMGPMSVAQYLEPGRLEFDLVIMDEASQLRPEDAIGAIARGRQVVIVGDDMQLPPTSFFDRIDDGDDDDDNLVVGQREESILRLAAQRFPKRMLSWHYRSQDEALIAFSNYKFYGSRLVLFPTPKLDPKKTGIEFHHVANGSVVEGVNDTEAQAVAKAALDHLRAHPTRSAIVVAMNIRQRERIRLHIEELSRGDLLIAHEEETSIRLEPFEVKNLENVQGDERDVVFISMTYGPDPASGRVLQRFGPINGEYGHRRLNVLFSRARQKMIIFSSMRHTDVLVGEASALGVHALRDFLYYAETKQLRPGATPIDSGRPPDSDFEIAVADALTAKGYECVAQLGVAGFFLDIAIRNPEKPGSFLLGVECDGASYHSTRSARDRDRLRQDILESLGWRIERVWSTDWFTDPAAEVRRLIGAVERALADARQETAQQGQGTVTAEEHSPTAVPVDGLSRDEARALLIHLRDREIYRDAPEADRTRGMLRQSMIDVLLRKLPTSVDEFVERVPLALREKTDAEQFSKYRAQVFAILQRVVE